MTIYENPQYSEDVRCVADIAIPWEKLKSKSVMLSGATGLIGSFLVDVLLAKNNLDGLDCTVYALVRDEQKARNRFSLYSNDRHLVFVPYDVRLPFTQGIKDADYILHLAANTHPMLYATDPIGTIATNILGLQNLLEYAVDHCSTRFLFASSNEIYGENRGDVELFDENYCGYIDCNSLRAGYPEYALDFFRRPVL